MLLLFPSKLIAQDITPPGAVVQEKDYTKDEIKQLVNQYADKHGVSRDLGQYIVSNESTYNVHAKGDMNKICTNKKSPYYGKPVEARGLTQLTKCYHWNVTDEQAYDPEFNLDYGMKLAGTSKEVCMQQFSTCREYYN